MKMKKQILVRLKPFLLSALMLLSIVIVAELISYFGLVAALGTWDVRNVVREHLADGDETAQFRHPELINVSGTDDEMIHPYLGYVLRKKTKEDPYGFGNWISPVQRKEDGKVIVAILGGSVAEDMFHQSISILMDEMKKSDHYKDKKIIPVLLALGGYKQPQQQMTMNYLLALGAEFDLVINLDGFNEVALPLTENRLVKVSSSFPREWRARVDPLEPWAFTPIMTIRFFKHLRSKTVSFVRIYPISHSYTVMALWELLDYFFRRTIQKAHHEYFYELPNKEIISYGPFREFVQEKDLFLFLAGIWSRASRGIAALSDEYHFQYFHFLQPNLHFDNSKIWSAEEEEFRASQAPFEMPVKKGYEYLINQGHELKLSREKFYDLSLIFKDVKETVYRDNCCHLNQAGYDMMAREIGKIIAKDSAGAGHTDSAL